MDDHKLTDMFLVPCCVMEVEKNPDGSCGMIRINSGNQAYCATMGPAYYDNMAVIGFRQIARLVSV